MGFLRTFNLLMSIMNLLDEYAMWYFPNLFNNSQKKNNFWGQRKMFVKWLAEG